VAVLKAGAESLAGLVAGRAPGALQAYVRSVVRRAAPAALRWAAARSTGGAWRVGRKAACSWRRPDASGAASHPAGAERPMLLLRGAGGAVTAAPGRWARRSRGGL